MLTITTLEILGFPKNGVPSGMMNERHDEEYHIAIGKNKENGNRSY